MLRGCSCVRTFVCVYSSSGVCAGWVPVSVHVHSYVRTSVCTCVWMSMCTRVRTSVHTHTCVAEHVHTLQCVNVCTHVCVDECVHTRVSSVCTRVWTSMCTHCTLCGLLRHSEAETPEEACVPWPGRVSCGYMVTNSKHNLQEHKEGNRTPVKLKKTSLLPQGLLLVLM